MAKTKFSMILTSPKDGNYRTRVISTRGYYYFRRFLVRVVFKRGYYSRAGTNTIILKFSIEIAKKWSISYYFNSKTLLNQANAGTIQERVLFEPSNLKVRVQFESG